MNAMVRPVRAIFVTYHRHKLQPFRSFKIQLSFDKWLMIGDRHICEFQDLVFSLRILTLCIRTRVQTFTTQIVGFITLLQTGCKRISFRIYLRYPKGCCKDIDIGPYENAPRNWTLSWCLSHSARITSCFYLAKPRYHRK